MWKTYECMYEEFKDLPPLKEVKEEYLDGMEFSNPNLYSL